MLAEQQAALEEELSETRAQLGAHLEAPPRAPAPPRPRAPAPPRVLDLLVPRRTGSFRKKPFLICPYNGSLLRSVFIHF